MQTPFHKWDAPGRNVNSPSFATGGLTFVTAVQQNREMMYEDGANFMESSSAPIPFRASRDGTTMAVLAGARTTSTSGTDVMRHHCWADVNGAGVRQVSSTFLRAPQGGARGYTIQRGPSSYYHWGHYQGPTTGFEISDNGDRIACVTHPTTLSVSSTSRTTWSNGRQDIIAWSTSNDWATSTQSFSSASYFNTPILWRMGAIVFTKDNNGMLFWAGHSVTNSTGGDPSDSTGSNYDEDQTSTKLYGCFYSWNFSTSTLRSTQASNVGGNINGIRTYNTTTSKVTWTATRFGTQQGAVQPSSGFISANRDFLYINNSSPIGSGAVVGGADSRTTSRLLGWNISSLSGPSINGHAAGEGFAVDAWPTRRSFIPKYYYPYYEFDFRYFTARALGGRWSTDHGRGHGLRVLG